jgi:hypothetical protein
MDKNIRGGVLLVAFIATLVVGWNIYNTWCQHDLSHRYQLMQIEQYRDQLKLLEKGNEGSNQHYKPEVPMLPKSGGTPTNLFPFTTSTANTAELWCSTASPANICR